ncbi:MAG: hypothetical protein AB8G05_17705 [Oligoflexales bacterium]
MVKTPSWMFYTLVLAGVYNLLWGAWVVLFPDLSMTLLGAEPVQPREIWQCVGMIVGVYGVGYVVAAADPLKHWLIVMVGFLGKVFGPIGFAKALWDGIFPLSFALNIVFNDLIWWLPFFLILKATYHKLVRELGKSAILDAAGVFASLSTLGIDSERTILLVALRHTGCTFTREAMSTLARQREALKQSGYLLVLIHMSEESEFAAFAGRYLDTGDYLQISDPQSALYRKLGLKQGQLGQVLGPKEWLRGSVGLLCGYGLGPLRGNGFQLAGLFLIYRQQFLREFRARHASEALPIAAWLNQSSLDTSNRS